MNEMLKRVLCMFLLVCMVVQSLPLTAIADAVDEAMGDGYSEEVTAEKVIPESFEIKGIDLQDGTVTVLSSEERTVSVIVTQYKNGMTHRVYSADAELIVGINTVAVPDYQRDEAATVKVMLWDGIGNPRPLCKALEIGAELLEVSFETNNSSLTVSSRTYPSNSSFGKLPTPVSDDFLFVGWYYDEDRTLPVLETDLVEDSCTLYAKLVELADLYEAEDTIFAERYVANFDAPSDTKVLIISDDSSLTKENVLSLITAENLSVIDKTEVYTVEEYTVEADSEKISCEADQQLWLDNAEEGTSCFVFSAEGGFAEGNSYKITLNSDSLSFAGHETTAREYNMSVCRESKSNLLLRDDIIFVDESFVNDANDDEVQLAGVSSDTPNKAQKRFSLNGASGNALVLSKASDGMRRIVVGSEGNGNISISGGESDTPEALNDETIAVFSQSDEGISLFGDQELTMPRELTLDNSALWDMDYRTVKGEVDGDFIYTDTHTRDILFKPDVFPIVGGDDPDENVVISVDVLNPENEFELTVTNPNTGEIISRSAKYSEFGITNDTTVDKGDFIAFINDGSCSYAKITSVEMNDDGDFSVETEKVEVGDILDSMDMYGERELSAKELTGLDDYTEVEKEIELQAVNSGFADKAAMYVSSVVIASEAFADISENFELNYEEIVNDLEQLADSDEIELMGGNDAIYTSKDDKVIVSKPDVIANIATEFEVNGKAKAGIKLSLAISGDITVKFGEDSQNTITITYSATFDQTLSAEISMSAEASIHYILWVIPVIDDCTVSANIDFYTTSDVHLGITAGLTSNKDTSTTEKVWYAPTSGERYHKDGCTHERKYIEYVPIEEARTIVYNKKTLTPCGDCKPESQNVSEVWYAPASGEKYHVKGCSHSTRYVEHVSLAKARTITTKSGKKLLPCERCQPEEKVYVLPYGDCYHRKNCSYLSQSTTVACTVPVAQEEGYSPCSQCCPGEMLAEGVASELKELLDKVNSIRETVTEASETVQDLKNKLEEARDNLGGVAPQEAADAGASGEAETMSSSLIAEKKLIERYQTLMSNAYVDWAEIYRHNLFHKNVFSFWGIINVSVAMDFCLYANLNVSMESSLYYENGKRYIFTINVFEGRVEQSVHELVPEQLAIDFTVIGTAGLKIGVELVVGVNLISDNLAQVSVSGEVGFYIKLWGYFSYQYLNKPHTTETSCHGTLYLEAGPYIDIGFSASVFGEYGWNPSIYYQEIPILTVGDRNAVIGFEKYDNNKQIRLRRNNKSIKLSNDMFSVEYLDLRTGNTGTTSYFNELKNAKQVSNEPYTYVSQHYTMVINNDDKDGVFYFDPATNSIKVEPDNDPEENAELIITYNLPSTSFNKTAITKKLQMYWDAYGDAHTIVFDSNGGDFVSPLIENSGKTIKLPTPVRKGYDFAGWSDGSNVYNNPFDENSPMLEKMPENDIELIAKWFPGETSYTVNHWQYDLNYIPQLVDSECIKAITESNTEAKPGTYTGFVTPDKKTEVVKGDGTTVIDYYYTRDSYTYELTVDDVTTRRKVLYGTPIVLTDRTIPGYDFLGWVDTDSGKSICELLGVEETAGTLTFNYEFDHDLSLKANVVPHENTPYYIELCTYQEQEFSGSDGDMYGVYYERLGTLTCYGETDTPVDLEKYEDDYFELVTLYENNKDTEDLQIKPNLVIENWDYDKESSLEVTKGNIDGCGTLVLRLYYERAKRYIDYPMETTNTLSLEGKVSDPVPIPRQMPENPGNTFGGWEYYYNNSEAAPAYRAEYDANEKKWTYRDGSTNEKVGTIPMPRGSYAVKAIWIPNTYKITIYDYDRESVVEIKEVVFGEIPESVTPPSYNGYIFKGYYYNKDNTQYYGANGASNVVYLVADDISLYPKREVIEYSITYEWNDAGSNSEVMNKGNYPLKYTVEKDVLFTAPYRPGYIFDGWYTTEDFAQGSEIESTEGHFEELTVYAKWVVSDAKYPIEYELNHGKQHKDNLLNYTIEEVEWILYEPSREGYTFIGWTSNTEGVTVEKKENVWLVKDGRDAEVRAEGSGILFVAEWTPNEYEASWSVPANASIKVIRTSSLKEGVEPGELSSGAEVYYGDELVIVYSVDAGYHISDSGAESIFVDSDITEEQIFVIPTANPYLVSYNYCKPQNATNNVICEDAQKNWTYDEYGKLPTPILEGWKFDDWYYDSEYKLFAGEGDSTVKNLTTAGTVTLYAKWIARTYTVTYNLNKPGDALSTTQPGSIPPQTWTFDHGETLPTPTLKGWKFKGWKVGSKTFAGDTSVKNLTEVYTENVELIAQWKANKYTVLYNVNKTSDVKIDRTVTDSLGRYMDENREYDKEFNLPNATLSGYTFDGWYYDLEYKRPAGEGGSTVKNLTTEGSVTLYPKWTAKTYTVTFDKMGAGLLKKAEIPGTYTGHNLTITYDCKEMMYTLTNSATSDPYATIGQEVYLTAGETYYVYMETTGSVQMFYAIGGAYTESGSKRFYSGQKNVQTIKVATSGTYKIRFDNDAGKTITIRNFWISDSCSTVSQAVTTDKNGAKITVPKDEGRRRFLGYYYGGTKYYDAEGNPVRPFDLADNVTMTAKWEFIGYSATWNTLDNTTITVKRTAAPFSGAATGTITSGATVYYGDVLSISYSANTGYSITSNGKTSITVAGEVTSSDIFVNVKGKSYKVTYDLNLSNNDVSPKCYTNATCASSGTVTFGVNNTLATPNADYYSFDGWYTDPINGSKITGSNWNIASEITLYAHWKKTYSEYAYVKTVADLKKISENTSGKYFLVADINVGSWTPLPTFYGTLNGNGKTISGMLVTPPDNANGGYGFISSIGNGGVVCNTKFESCRINFHPEGEGKNDGAFKRVDCGIIAGSNSGTISDCTVSGCYGINMDSFHRTQDQEAYAGLICGLNYGVVSGCTAQNSEIFVHADSYGGSKQEQRTIAVIGGICGYNVGKVNHCKSYNNKLTARVWWFNRGKGSECVKVARSAGIVGDNQGSIENHDVKDNTTQAQTREFWENIFGLHDNGYINGYTDSVSTSS